METTSTHIVSLKPHTTQTSRSYTIQEFGLGEDFHVSIYITQLHIISLK